MSPLSLLARLLAKKAAKKLAKRKKKAREKAKDSGKTHDTLGRKIYRGKSRNKHRDLSGKRTRKKEVEKSGRRKSDKPDSTDHLKRKAVIGGLKSTMKKAIPPAKEAAKIGGLMALGAAAGKAIPDGPIDKKNKRDMENEKKKKKEKKVRSILQKRRDFISGAVGSRLSISARQKYLLTGDIDYPKKRKKDKKE